MLSQINCDLYFSFVFTVLVNDVETTDLPVLAKPAVKLPNVTVKIEEIREPLVTIKT